MLIDDHGPGFYHMGTGRNLQELLNESGVIEASIFEDAEVLATDLPFDYDVLLIHFKNYRLLKRDEKARTNLLKFVEAGGGIFVFHFACGAFENWAEYESVAGRVWDPKKPPHDPYGVFTVRLKDKTHPITENLSDFEITDELYTCLKESDTKIHVLADAVSKADGKVHPMIFSK